MATISLSQVRHSYVADPRGEEDYALKRIDAVWEDGGAYALLGPSGCGKTTLLNIISGLLTPSEGTVLFDGVDVTATPTSERHIAQVFQFPVVYDTMTVYDNLAFPLRNRGVSEDRIDARVLEIAAGRGITKVFLEVRASNEAALRLYTRHGFADVGVRRGYYEQPKEDARVMMAALG